MSARPPEPPALRPATPDDELGRLLRTGLAVCRRQRRGMGLLWLEVQLLPSGVGTAQALPSQHTAQVWIDLLLRLRRRVRATDHVLGLGEGRYAVLINGADDTVAGLVAERLRRGLAEPHGLGPLRQALQTRIGLACCPTDGQTAEELLAKAQQDLRA